MFEQESPPQKQSTEKKYFLQEGKIMTWKDGLPLVQAK